MRENELLALTWDDIEFEADSFIYGEHLFTVMLNSIFNALDGAI
jgi:hypothetical protein